MRRLLIVEDNKDFAEQLKEALSEDDEFQVVEMIADEATVYKRFKENILQELDCLLLDLHLPAYEGDKSVYSAAGLRILATARQTYDFNGTVIILTSSREPQDGQRALAAGCDGYLCKYAPLAEIGRMLSELKVALHGSVTIFSHEMKHVFLRDEISSKEAQLLDMLCEGASWADIARHLDYKTPKAAANTGDRIYDKILAKNKNVTFDPSASKRDRAVEVWKESRKSSRSNQESAKISTISN